MRQLLTGLVWIIALSAGCESENANPSNNQNNQNNQQPTLVSYDHSECKGAAKTMDSAALQGFECVAWSYDGAGALALHHVNARFNCCPDDTLGLTGEVAFEGNTITLTESDNGGNCRCECPYDLSYELRNVAPGAYQVVVAPFEAPLALELAGAGEGAFCIDRLTNIEQCVTAGGRACSCGSPEDCTLTGYCLALPELGSYCVDTCETTQDCPVPELESCEEDPEGVRHCYPMSADQWNG